MAEGQAPRRLSRAASKRVAAIPDAGNTEDATAATGSGMLASAASRKRRRKAVGVQRAGQCMSPLSLLLLFLLQLSADVFVLLMFLLRTRSLCRRRLARAQRECVYG